MFKPYLLCCAMASAVAVSVTAHAAGDDELKQIREQIRDLKNDYDARIQALELKLKEAEAKPVQPAATRRASATAASNTFNPNISLILSGAYKNLSQNPNNYRIGGFIPSGPDSGPGKRGFSLGESEITMAANIDPFYAGQFTMSAASDNTLSVEEAFVTAAALGNGLNVKLGRFFSGIGYLNEQHAHTWDFADNPLAYNAFLGNQFTHDGAQLKWLAPTDTFLEFGAELGNGSGFPGNSINKNGLNARSLFAHTAGEIGDSHSWRAGLSYLQTSAQNRTFDDSIQGATTNFAYNGNCKIAIADFVWKWAPNGNVINTNVKLQGEYFRRKDDGTLAFINPLIVGPQNNFNNPYASNQSGWYLQGVYQFMPQWRAGLRYDRLSAGDITLAGNSTLGAAFLANYQPSRMSLMFDYNPSEFSRLRLQAAQDKSRADATDNQLTLQYIYSLGAHGAHKY